MNAPAHLDPGRRGRTGSTGADRTGNRSGDVRGPSLRRVLCCTGLALAALALAACGSSSASTTSTTTKSLGTARGSGAGGSGAGQRQFPGASGTIAAINGSTLEVQGTSSQTSVTYTSTTTFSQTVAGTAANVTVGSCISAFGKPTSSGSATKGATFDRPITATTVSISQPQSGTCARGFGGFGNRAGATGSGGTGSGGTGSRTFSGGGGGPEGGFGSGGQGRRPTTGAASRFGGQFGAVSGRVTAVNGAKVTVSETDPRLKKTTSVVVTLGSTATFAVQQSAAAADLVVGHCATALGTAGSTGAITARSITLSTPGADGCTARFAGPGGAAPGGAAGA